MARTAASRDDSAKGNEGTGEGGSARAGRSRATAGRDGQATQAAQAAEPEVSAPPAGAKDEQVKAKGKDKAKARDKAGTKAKAKASPAAAAAGEAAAGGQGKAKPAKLKTKDYEAELARLQVELVKMQAWVKHAGLKVVVVFEGRDAAGKGGVIKRITEPLNPRSARVAALAAPTEREQGQWYFQRYVAHLPTAGEIVLFDRSWYNRAGVERVMGFVDEEGYREFLRSTPEFETLLQRSGIILVKYWFSVSDAEQERRFTRRIQDVTRRWKLSPMDLQSRARWVDYSRAKDAMFLATDTPTAPWWVVDADDKKRARLNCITHLLSTVPYQDMTPEPVELPERPDPGTYVRPPMNTQRFVPNTW